METQLKSELSGDMSGILAIGPVILFVIYKN